MTEPTTRGHRMKEIYHRLESLLTGLSQPHRITKKRSDFNSPKEWEEYLESVLCEPDERVIVNLDGTCSPISSLEKEQGQAAPLPVSTMQGVDCPMCEADEPHRHAAPSSGVKQEDGLREFASEILTPYFTFLDANDEDRKINRPIHIDKLVEKLAALDAAIRASARESAFTEAAEHFPIFMDGKVIACLGCSWRPKDEPSFKEHIQLLFLTPPVAQKGETK